MQYNGKVSPTAEVYAVRRLRLADAETMAIEFLNVPRTLLPNLTQDLLEGASFYTLLQQEGVTIVSGVQTIEPTVTTEEEAEVLGVPLHAPAFLFERITESERGEVVEFVRSVYRGCTRVGATAAAVATGAGLAATTLPRR